MKTSDIFRHMISSASLAKELDSAARKYHRFPEGSGHKHVFQLSRTVREMTCDFDVTLHWIVDQFIRTCGVEIQDVQE